MTWEPETREKFHKQIGDYRLVPERNKEGQTAHLLDLGDRKIRVLPDATHSGQKRATVARRALEQVAALNGVPVDLVETYLIGVLSREDLEWEFVTSDPTCAHENLDAAVEEREPKGMMRAWISCTDCDGFWAGTVEPAQRDL